MSFEIELEDGETLRYRNSVDDRSHPMAFGITDRAVFMSREQHFRVDSFYMHRIPLEDVREVTLSRDRSLRAWVFGVLVTVSGGLLSVAAFIGARLTPEHPPSLGGTAGAVCLLIVGLILLYDSRWQLALNIRAEQTYRWKPSIFAKRSAVRLLQEDFLTACWYFDIPTHRDDIVTDGEIDAFWKWFNANSQNAPSSETVEARLEKLAASTRAVLNANRATKTLTISADHKRNLFPIVEKIVNRAPVIPGWSVVAFLQPEAIGDEFTRHGCTLQLNKIFFEPTVYDFFLGISVYGPWEETGDDFDEAAILLIQRLLGEYEYVVSIDGLNIFDISDHPEPQGLYPIQYLPEFIRQFSILETAD